MHRAAVGWGLPYRTAVALRTAMDRSRKRLGVKIVGGVLAVCLLVVLVALLVAPTEADGYWPEANAQVVGFCTRSAPDVEDVDGGAGADADAACLCAYGELARTVPWDRFVQMDEALRSGDGE